MSSARRLAGFDPTFESLAQHAHGTEFHCSVKLITATRADASVLHCRTMVAFHEGMGLSSTIAGESLFRNRIPETPQARRLCNGMKSNISNNDDELHSGGTAKPGIQKTLDSAVLSGTCVVAHDNAATWMMSTFTGSSLLISLMSTVASLPFFLFTLPAGALADRVDRQKLVCTINVCMAAAGLALAVLGWMHLLNPYLILGGVFFIGVGFAINPPAWASIVRQVVSDGDLPSAATLGSLQFSIAGIIGPVLGGLLVLLAGANFVFALNAACFLLVAVAIRQWKLQPCRQSSRRKAFSNLSGR